MSDDVQVAIGANTDDLNAAMQTAAQVVQQSQETVVAALNTAKESFADLGAAGAKWAQMTVDSAGKVGDAVRSAAVDYKALIDASTGVASANKSAADSASYFEDMMGVSADRAKALRDALTTVDGEFTDLGSRFAPAANAAAGGLGDMSNAARSASTTMAGFFQINRAGRMELQAAAVNFVQGVSSGISPLRMLQTEGTQVMGALIQGGAVSASAMIGIGGAIAVAAAAVVGLGVAYNQGASQSKAFNSAMALTANAAGITASAMAGIRDEALKTGDISAGTAQAIATDMVNTGQISQQVIERLIGLTADYAKATNQSSSEAGAALTKAFQDPAKAMSTLDDAFNLLSDAEKQHIQDLIEQGDKTQAQIEITDALGARIHSLADQDLGYLAQALKSTGEAWDTFVNKLESFGRTESVGEKLADVRQQIAALEQEKQDFDASPQASVMSFGRQGELNGLQTQEANLQAQAGAESAGAAMQAQAAQAQTLSKQMGDAARSADSFGKKQQDLQNEIIAADNAAKVFKDQIDALGGASSGPDQKQLETLNQALTNAKKVADNAAGSLKALRTPLQEAQDALKISQTVSALPKDQQAPVRAKLTTQDQLSHSADPVDRQEADARAELAFEKAVADQKTQITKNSVQEQIAAMDAEVAATQQGSQERVDKLKQEADLIKSVYGDQSKEYQQVMAKVNAASVQASQQQTQDQMAAINRQVAEAQQGSQQRVDLLTQETNLAKQQWGEGSKEYENALKQQEDAERQHQHQITQLQMDAVDAQEQMDELGLADKRAQYDLDVQLNKLTNSEKLADLKAFENESYAIKLQAQQKRVALAAKDPTTSAPQTQKLNNQLLQLDRQHNNQMSQIDRQAIQQKQQMWTGIVSPITGAMGSIVTSMISGDQTLAQSASQAALGMASSFIQAGEDRLTSYLVNLAIGDAAAETSADTQIGTSAAVAAAGSYSSASAIPYVGWIIAPAVAAVALGAVMAFKGGLAVGTPNVPADMMTTVHKGEIVAPRTMSEGIRSGDLALVGPGFDAGGGSGSGSGGSSSGGDFHMNGNINVMHGGSKPLTPRDLMKTIQKGWRDNPELRPR